jgi:hypothetical protein
MIRMMVASLIVSCLAGCGKDVSRPSETEPSSIEFADWLTQAQKAQILHLVQKQGSQMSTKSDRPPEPIQREMLELIHSSMPEAEVIGLLGGPSISASQTEKDSAIKVLFYCLAPVGDPKSEKGRNTLKAVEVCSVPIVIKEGIVIGSGWDFYRDYIQSHQLEWSELFEMVLSGFCSSGIITHP